MSRPSLKNRPPVAFEILSGGGDMGALVRSHDWSATDLGPIQAWPQSLLTAVSICLTSRFPMVVFWGPNLNVIYNDAYRPSLGSKHPAILGRPAREIWPDAWAILGPMMMQVVERGEATWSEDHFLLMDRRGFPEETYWTFSYSPIHDEAGVVEGVFTAVSETTSRVLGERRLRCLRELGSKATRARTAEAAARVTAEVLSASTKDLPFSLIYLAEGDERLRLGGASGLAEGGFAAPATIERARATSPLAEAAFRVLQSGEPVTLEVTGATLGVGWEPDAPMRAIALPIRSSDQERAFGVVVIGVSPNLVFDESYRGFLGLVSGQLATALATARAYEEEKTRAESLAELDRAKTTFFSNVSHEFRTPLTLMLGPLEDALADARAPLDPAQRDRLELTYRSALRLLKLVNSLLDFSRIEAGRAQARYRPTDLSQLTTELCSVFRSAIEKAGLDLVVSTPDLDEPIYVDREMWEKIVLNLLSNAYKFTFQGRIEVTQRVVDGTVRLAVRDTGTGIAERDLPHLFERFHRVEGARGRTYEGTGIGLALVQELVKLHGGSIAVRSAVGEGTEFIVEIPRGHAHLPAEHIGTDEGAARSGKLGSAFVEEALRWLPDAESVESVESAERQRAAPPAASTARASSDAQPPARVLLADDNTDMRGYVKGLLERAGWSVEAVADGEAAYEAARARRPDLILTDVMMPKMSGFELLQKLKSAPATAEVPVVLLSARAGEESRIEGLSAGADDYLVKPFSANELIARVRTHLQLGRLRTEASVQREELRSIFTQAPVAIAVLDGPTHVYTLSNDAHDAFLGSKRDILGKPIREALPELNGQGLLDLLDRAYRTGEPVLGREVAVRFSLPDGATKDIFADFIYQPRHDVEGRVDGIVAIAIDVTAKVVARREAEKLAADLRAALASRDEFLSIASHELRTPLTSLRLQLQRAKRWFKPECAPTLPPDRLGPILDHSLKQTERLAELIEELLDVARIRAGKLAFCFTDVNVEELFGEIVERFSEQLEAARCPLVVSVAPGLVARWDRSRIEQVLVNLIGNAVKYAPGNPIYLSAAERGDHVVVTVQDRGPGILKERQPQIFERFERATSSRNISGLGLGLYIVRQIVEGHQGSVRVESDEGQGATFIVELPRSAGPTQSATTWEGEVRRYGT